MVLVAQRANVIANKCSLFQHISPLHTEVASQPDQVHHKKLFTISVIVKENGGNRRIIWYARLPLSERSSAWLSLLESIDVEWYQWSMAELVSD